MSGGDAPSMPSPWEQADANTSQAKATAAFNQKLAMQNVQANRPTQVTPWGTTSWSRPSFNEADWAKQVGLSQFDQAAWQAANPRKKNEGPKKYANRMAAAQKTQNNKYQQAVAKAKTNFDKTNNDWTQTTSLNPKAQEALDSQQDIQKKLSDVASNKIDEVSNQLSKPLDTSQFQPWQAAPTADASVRQKAEDAIYGRATSRLDPQFNTEQQSLQTELANQGLSPGTAAWNQAMDQFGRTKNDAYANARNDAIVGGGQEMSNLFGMGLQSAGFNNGLRNNQIQSESFLRGLPLSELQGLLSGQGVNQPSFSGFSQQAGTQMPGQPNVSDLMQNSYQSQLSNYNAQQAKNTQMAQAGASAVGSYLTMALAAY